MQKVIQKIVMFVCLVSTLLLTGCFEFDEPPFPDSELTDIRSTEIGKKLVEMSERKGVAQNKITEKLATSVGLKVFVIEDDFLVSQRKNKKGSGWKLLVLMKSNTHVIVCYVADQLLTKAPEGVIVKSIKGKVGNKTFHVSGDPKGFKTFAINLARNETKYCVAQPFLAD